MSTNDPAQASEKNDEQYHAAMVMFLIEGGEREEADLLLQCSVKTSWEYDGRD